MASADMGFDSSLLPEEFGPRIQEDTVEYEIRLLGENTSEQDLRQRLRKIESAGTLLVKKLLRGYIWQRDPFVLEIVREGGRSLLRGRTTYGDSVEDEWLILYLLRELSRQFPAAWVRVFDNDGEFLLVEAANVLPKWVNPDVAEHRVWINGGELLLIPPSPTSEGSTKQPASFLSLPQALAALRRPRSELIHSPIIEEEAFYRLRNYPDQIQQNFHHAVIRIPRRLAFVLNQLPASVSPAGEAFYLRDPVALKPLREKEAKDLMFPPEDFVTARVKFTRVGYAQLRGQRFLPIGVWATEERNEEAKDGRKESEKREIGMKLSCGFEMLVGDPQNQDSKSVREIRLLLDDLERGDEKLPIDEEVRSWGLEADDDAWLDIDFRDFDNELSGRQGRDSTTNRSHGRFGDEAAQENLQKLVSRFESFLNDDELADDDEDDDDDDEEDDKESSIASRADADGEDKATSFDEDEFTALMREMMGLPPEAMRELMGPHAAKASGLAEEEHPDFTQGGKDLEQRMQKLFDAIDLAGGAETQKETEAAGAAKIDGEKKQEQKKKEKAEQQDNEDDEQIKQLSALMEAELRGAGALDLSDPSVKKLERSRQTKGPAPTARTRLDTGDDGSEDEDDDEEPDLLDDDYNLVANMLRSFGGQAGMAGPAGNMMGMMGVNLPRDDGESDEDDDIGKVGTSKGQGKARV